MRALQRVCTCWAVSNDFPRWSRGVAETRPVVNRVRAVGEPAGWKEKNASVSCAGSVDASGV